MTTTKLDPDKLYGSLVSAIQNEGFSVSLLPLPGQDEWFIFVEDDLSHARCTVHIMVYGQNIRMEYTYGGGAEFFIEKGDQPFDPNEEPGAIVERILAPLKASATNTSVN